MTEARDGRSREELALESELDQHVRVGRRVPLVMRGGPRRSMPPRHWLDLDKPGRMAAVAELGLPTFRADQISRQYLGRLELDPLAWADLPLAARAQVAEALFPALLTPVREQSCDGGTTIKTLWRLHDGSLIESVLMRYGVPGVRASGSGRPRATLCISSQAGCGMACPFCATGQGGPQRNLSTAEIVEQVVVAAARLNRGEVPGGPGRLSNVVFMGMGEPMVNYDNVMRAVRTLVTPEPDGLGLSARGLTVSTVGLAPRMRKLAEEGLPLTLALSLHAPDDELRDELCPINTRYNVAETLDAARAYFDATGRRVSIEYALIRDINDQVSRADLLAKELNKRGRGWVHVNLIPLNPTPGSKWTASRRADSDAFVDRLDARGVPVTVRDTRGREIDGACGQLAATEITSA